jgi:hypothetical protein
MAMLDYVGIIVTVLVAIGSVYMGRMLWILSRPTARLPAGIEVVRALGYRIDSLSKQTPQLQDSAKLVSTEVGAVLYELEVAKIRDLPFVLKPRWRRYRQTKRPHATNLAAALTALERTPTCRRAFCLCKLGYGRGCSDLSRGCRQNHDRIIIA